MVSSLIRMLEWMRIIPLRQAVQIVLGSFSPDEERDIWVKPLQRNVRLRPGTSDIHVLRQVVLMNEYELPFKGRLRTIVDAGANIGLAALMFHSRHPEAVIHAIEPEPRNYQILEFNCRDIPNIHLHQAALWPCRADLKLADASAEPWAFACEEGEGGGQGIAVLTPEELVEKCGGHVDLFKIDIEGGEKQIFSAESEWLDDVSVLALELHDSLVQGCSEALYKRMVTRRFAQAVRGENIFIRLQNLNQV